MKITLELNTKQLQTLKVFTGPQDDENFRFLDRLWGLNPESIINLVDAVCESYDYFKNVETSGNTDVKVKTEVELSQEQLQTLTTLSISFTDETAEVLAHVFGVETDDMNDLMWTINGQIS